LVIANFEWIALSGSVVESTAEFTMKHNLGWELDGSTGIYPRWQRDVAVAGFTNIETFSFAVPVAYNHEAWRARIRASADVGGTFAPARVDAFDREFAALFERRFPTDPMAVHHRAFALVCRAA
jgi:hypothetical protein